MNINTVTVVGNTTRDPELRYTASGRAVASFGLAHNERRKNGDDWEDVPHFFNVVAWGDLAENVCQSAPKGTRIVVSGRLQQRSWEKDGEKQSVVEIVASTVGADLTWATAEVTRTERRGGDGERSSKGGGGRKSAPARSAADAYDDDEEF